MTDEQRPWRRPTVRIRVLGHVITILLCGVSLPAIAQSVPEGAYAAMRWRSIGPFRGGRVLAVAGVPGDPTTFYFGAVDGGVWKTTNAGLTWTPRFDEQPIASIGAPWGSTTHARSARS